MTPGFDDSQEDLGMSSKCESPQETQEWHLEQREGVRGEACEVRRAENRQRKAGVILRSRRADRPLESLIQRRLGHLQ